MRATKYEIQKCREILKEIDPHIPSRGYVKPVQDLYKKRKLDVPNRRKIVAVRNGKEYSLEIVKVLAEISQPRDEEGNLIPPRDYGDVKMPNSGLQHKIFQVESTNK